MTTCAIATSFYSSALQPPVVLRRKASVTLAKLENVKRA